MSEVAAPHHTEFALQGNVTANGVSFARIQRAATMATAAIEAGDIDGCLFANFIALFTLTSWLRVCAFIRPGLKPM